MRGCDGLRSASGRLLAAGDTAFIGGPLASVFPRTRELGGGRRETPIRKEIGLVRAIAKPATSDDGRGGCAAAVSYASLAWSCSRWGRSQRALRVRRRRRLPP